MDRGGIGNRLKHETRPYLWPSCALIEPIDARRTLVIQQDLGAALADTIDRHRPLFGKIVANSHCPPVRQANEIGLRQLGFSGLVFDAEIRGRHPAADDNPDLGPFDEQSRNLIGEIAPVLVEVRRAGLEDNRVELHVAGGPFVDQVGDDCRRKDRGEDSADRLTHRITEIELRRGDRARQRHVRIIGTGPLSSGGAGAEGIIIGTGLGPSISQMS